MKLLSILRSLDQLPVLQKAGADGILLGIDGLSYRIPTFSVEISIDILNQAHLLGLDVFLSLNRLLDEDEISDAMAFIDQISNVGFTGIYFQDLAYMHFCARKNLQLIYAPEAIITSSMEVEALCSSGIDRIMIAKELMLEEIAQIASNNPLKVEMFGFGHLPMSVSRRPLVRNYLEEIKKDPTLSLGVGLRLKEVKRTVFYPILEDEKETVIFADTVFCALNELKRLDENGIYAILADDLFVEAGLLAEFIVSCKMVLNGGDARTEVERLRNMAPEFTFSSGYFYKKTNLAKEGAGV